MHFIMQYVTVLQIDPGYPNQKMQYIMEYTTILQIDPGQV